MTTPRVTVPVEPEYTATDYLRLIAEGWEVIESTGSQMTIQNPEDDGPQDLVIDVDLLSAAPAPEGGDVGLIHDLTTYRDSCQDGLVRAPRSIFSRAIEALATREEAQPVCWLDAAQKRAVERAAMDAGAYSWRNARLAMVESNKVIGYPAFSRADMAELARLHTHPAPDALRVAVEALEKTRDRIQQWPIDDHETCMCGSTIEAHDIGSGHSPVSQADHAISIIVEEINKALAALQAEQKGGA